MITTASFSGSDCGTLNVINATCITCTTSVHSAGAVDVVVTNTDSPTGTGTDAYTYQPAPAVGSVSQLAGDLTGGKTACIEKELHYWRVRK